MKQLTDPTTKDRFMRSLERGNVHQVTFPRRDKEEKMFFEVVEANAQFKSLTVYDSNMGKAFQESKLF